MLKRLNRLKHEVEREKVYSCSFAGLSGSSPLCSSSWVANAVELRAALKARRRSACYIVFQRYSLKLATPVQGIIPLSILNNGNFRRKKSVRRLVGDPFVFSDLLGFVVI